RGQRLAPPQRLRRLRHRPAGQVDRGTEERKAGSGLQHLPAAVAVAGLLVGGPVPLVGRRLPGDPLCLPGTHLVVASLSCRGGNGGIGVAPRFHAMTPPRITSRRASPFSAPSPLPGPRRCAWRSPAHWPRTVPCCAYR